MPHCSPIGLIPKPHQLIVDLSAPRDRRVNDGIPADLYMFTRVCNGGARSYPSVGLWQGYSNGTTRPEECLPEDTGAPQRSNAARYRVGGGGGGGGWGNLR